MLNEKKIKCLLLDYLEGRSRGMVIGAEVPFLSGNRWADVVSISAKGELAAFEIKSDHDSLRRMAVQLRDYIRTFHRVNFVFSEKFKNQAAIRKIPRSVGIAFYDAFRKKIVFKRLAQKRRRLSKDHLLKFLWDRDLSTYRRNERESVEVLRKRMKRGASLFEIQRAAARALRGRYYGRYELFLKEKSGRAQIEDLEFLTRTIWGSLPGAGAAE